MEVSSDEMRSRQQFAVLRCEGRVDEGHTGSLALIGCGGCGDGGWD